MPNLYASKMLEALSQVGKPIVTKQTGTTTGTTKTTADQNQGLDLGTLMSLLLLMMNKNKQPAMDYAGAAREAGNAASYLAPAKGLAEMPVPGADTVAGTGNPSPELADALAGIALSGYLSRTPGLVPAGGSLPTGTNPLAKLSPADIIRLLASQSA